MIKKSYLILAHKNPSQLKMLVDSLDDENSFFYIHIDKNADINLFLKVIKVKENIIFVEKREVSTWGDIGLVIATINCMKLAIKNNKDGYCILLSGQDFPIKSKNEIDNYLLKNRGYEFIDITPLDDVIKTSEWQSKLEFYKYNLSNEKGKFILMPPIFHKAFYSITTIKNFIKIILYINKVNVFKIISNLFKKRIPPMGISPYAGGQWWAMSANMVERILIFLERNENFITYHKDTLIPDEIFFQSIIMDFVKKDFSIRFKKCFTYANFTRKNCNLPITFEYNEIDIDELLSAGDDMLFARKFDIDLDKEIISFLIKRTQNNKIE